ncbi:MAG: transketolase C-terminal domain-containing protein [Candidatus Woesearchaeota archaeon]
MGMDIRVDEIKKIPESDLEQLVKEIKGDVLTLVHDAGSGHCGGSLSLVKPMLAYFMSAYDGLSEPHLSKGHCTPVLYSIGHRFGNITDEEMSEFRKLGGLAGHSDTRVQRVPSGVLGQGAGIANGMAKAERLKSADKKVYVFLGDGEMDEPYVLSAMNRAIEEGLDVCFVMDNNTKNLTGDLCNDFEKKIDSIKTLEMPIRSADNMPELIEHYLEAEEIDGPFMIIYYSKKGEGVSFMEQDKSGWHGSPLDDDHYKQAMKELGLEPKTFSRSNSLCSLRQQDVQDAMERLKMRGLGRESEATRNANEILAELGDKDKRLVVLIPDIGSSVKVDKFAKRFPERFYDVGIDEMEATLEAAGLAAKGFRPVVSTFDAFTYIPLSAIRIADYAKLPIGFIMTHSEFIGEDGPTHLMTENLGAWRGLYNIGTIANPADIMQAHQAIEYSLEKGDMFYVRLGRPKVPTLYSEDTLPEAGKASILMQGKGLTILTTGQEVWESLIAAEMLKKDGFDPTVVNIAYFRPFDIAGVCTASQDNHVFVTEAHNPEVGLASMVSYELMRSGTPVKSFTPLGVTGYVPTGSILEQKGHCHLLGEQIYRKVKEKFIP